MLYYIERRHTSLDTYPSYATVSWSAVLAASIICYRALTREQVSYNMRGLITHCYVSRAQSTLAHNYEHPSMVQTLADY